MSALRPAIDPEPVHQTPTIMSVFIMYNYIQTFTNILFLFYILIKILLICLLSCFLHGDHWMLLTKYLISAFTLFLRTQCRKKDFIIKVVESYIFTYTQIETSPGMQTTDTHTNTETYTCKSRKLHFHKYTEFFFSYALYSNFAIVDTTYLCHNCSFVFFIVLYFW